MAKQEKSNADFWLNLLEEGHSEDEKKDNWNMCLFAKIGQIESYFSSNSPQKVVAMKDSYSGRNTYETVQKWKNYPALPELPQEPNIRIESYMNFSNEEFPENISFAGRVLIGADFRQAVFKGWADFRGAVFLGCTHFDGARFEGRETMQPPANYGQVSFTNAVFGNTAYFKSAEFPRNSWFENAEFLSAGYFQNAIFGNNQELGAVVFDNVTFGSEANFENATFESGGGFDNVTFNAEANFKKTKFCSKAHFNKSIFNGTTTFQGATFRQPPKFFETEVHEDTNINGIDWHQAERFYSKPNHKDVTRDKIKERAENAVLAWERLALIMSRQEKPWERHQFFRLKMRAQRHADGMWSISSIANRIFDVLSDYGWGIGCAFTWWIGHIVLFWMILAGAACYQIQEKGCQWQGGIIRDGFLVSLANSLSFLRLKSGYLSGNYKDLAKDLEQVMWLFSTVGTIQAILGPILLFLVLLTLRNRFRIG